MKVGRLLNRKCLSLGVGSTNVELLVRNFLVDERIVQAAAPSALLLGQERMHAAEQVGPGQKLQGMMAARLLH